MGCQHMTLVASLTISVLDCSEPPLFYHQSGGTTPTRHHVADCHISSPGSPLLVNFCLRLRSRHAAPLVSFLPSKTGRILNRVWKGFGIRKIQQTSSGFNTAYTTIGCR